MTNAQNGNGSFIDDNDWDMVAVDVDTTTPGIFDSSTAALNLPAGATALFAGLYWMGNSNSVQRTQVKLDTPASGSYNTISGTLIGDSSSVNPVPIPSGPNYEGFANVTSLVRAGGNGDYTAANVQADTGEGLYAGWTLVVAYQAPGDPPRNLTVFDGYAVVQFNDPAVTIPISGFVAPPAGAVNARIGVVSADGDKGFTGDSIQLNGTALSSAQNPANNFFNSSISNLGAPVTAKNPNYLNQLGFDADVVSVPAGVIRNNDTSAVFRMTTNLDSYFPGVVTSAIDLHAPDVDANKTVTDLNGGETLPGDVLEYTVNLTNTGQDAAENVNLIDQIPANTTYVPGSLSILSGANAGSQTDAAGDDQATFDAANNEVLFNLGVGATSAAGGTLAIGASTAIRFRVQVNSNVPGNTVVANQATTNYVGATTTFPFTSLSTVPVVIIATPTADLAVDKAVSDPTPNVGDEITYTVTATNNGPNNATGVSVSDSLPAGLTFVSADPTQGTYSSATGVWSVGTLNKGASASLLLRARVDSAIARTNTATIAASNAQDPNPANNTASATETPQRADLVVTKTVSNATPNVGDQINFTVTLTNAGPNAATGVELEDLLPNGLTLVSSMPSQGDYDPGTGVWIVGTVAPATPQTLTIDARVVSAQASTNTATITGADQFDPNTANNEASVTETPQQADLAVTKTVSDATPNVGDQITFTITLTNSGPSNASGIQVTDLLPTGLTLVTDDPSQGTYTPGTGVWDVGAVAGAGSASLTITATVDGPDVQTNTATITASDQFDPNTGNNSASATETPQRADLVITKAVSNSTPNLGDTITYILAVDNSGPNTGTGVIVTDMLPTGVTFVSDNPSQGSYDDVTGIWTVGTVAVAATPTLTITVTVNSVNQIVNTATVAGDQFDPNLTNNTDSTSTDAQAADLAVLKTVSDPTPNVGDQVTFTVTVINTGPNTATGVQVTDLLPAGLTFVSDNPSEGAYDEVSGLWDVGTVATGTPQTLTIVATVVSAAAQTNTATVSHADQTDPNTANNSDVATETPQHADLALTKSVSNSTPNVGDQVTFTVTLSNSGPDTATGVQVTDLLPAGLTFVSDQPSQGVYAPGSGIWDVGAVASGTPQTLEIVATVISAAAQTNTSTVTDSDQFDPNTANNTASATESPQQADLDVTKTVSDATPNVGDVITFTVTVTNQGPDTATNVQITDVLPPGLTPVLTRARRGTFASQVWDVGTLAPGDSSTLTITARVDSPDAQTNTASVTNVDQFDPNTANDTASATETPQQADLSITKTDGVTSAVPGTAVTYTIVVTNNGPSAATNVVVADTFPATLTGVTWTSVGSAGVTGNDPSGGGNINDTVTFIPVGGTVTYTVTATIAPAATGSLANTATINFADQFDPNPSNNSATDTTALDVQYDLSITKTDNQTTAIPGTTTTYTIVVTNAGLSAATNVLVADIVPAALTGVTWTSVGSTGVVGNDASGSGNINDTVTFIPVGGTVTYTVLATIAPNATGTLSNTATVSGADDTNASDNSATDTTDLNVQYDLSITKTDGVISAVPGMPVTYTIVVTNNGPSAATDVLVTDTFPAALTGLTWTSVGSTGVVGNDVSGSGNINDTVTFIPVGGTVTYTVTATIDPTATGTLSNTATVSPPAGVTDPDPANNSATDTTALDVQYDLSITKTDNQLTDVPGTSISYTIVVTNAGPSAATNVVVTDTLPATLTGVTWTSVGSAGVTGNDASGSGNINDTVTFIPVGGTVTYTVLATIAPNATGTLSNTATVSPPAGVTDPDPANNSATDTTALDVQYDLSITKDRRPVLTAVPGTSITYTIVVTNAGPSTAATRRGRGRPVPLGDHRGQLDGGGLTRLQRGRRQRHRQHPHHRHPASRSAAPPPSPPVATDQPGAPPARPGQHGHGGRAPGGHHPGQQQRHRHRQPDAQCRPEPHQDRRTDQRGAGDEHQLHRHRQQRRPCCRHRCRGVSDPLPAGATTGATWTSTASPVPPAAAQRSSGSGNMRSGHHGQRHPRRAPRSPSPSTVHYRPLGHRQPDQHRHGYGPGGHAHRRHRHRQPDAPGRAVPHED